MEKTRLVTATARIRRLRRGLVSISDGVTRTSPRRATGCGRGRSDCRGKSKRDASQVGKFPSAGRDIASVRDASENRTKHGNEGNGMELRVRGRGAFAAIAALLALPASASAQHLSWTSSAQAGGDEVYVVFTEPTLLFGPEVG